MYESRKSLFEAWLDENFNHHKSDIPLLVQKLKTSSL